MLVIETLKCTDSVGALLCSSQLTSDAFSMLDQQLLIKNWKVSHLLLRVYIKDELNRLF